MSTTINMTQTSAADRLGLLPDCSWEQALGCFNQKRARLYAKCILPLTPEDEQLLYDAVLPFYEALRFLFPIQVQQEQSFRQIAVQPEVIPPPAPIKPLPPKPTPPVLEKERTNAAPSGWGPSLLLRICWKSIVLFPGFAVGLAALLVTAWWKYILIAGVFAASFRMQEIALLPLLCVLAIEGTKVLSIVLQEYWKVHHPNTRFPWATAVKWLQISLFALSVIGLAGLVGAYAREQPGSQDDMSPALAAFATVEVLTEMTGCSSATAITMISLLLASLLDLCIYVLFSSVAFEIFRTNLLCTTDDNTFEQTSSTPSGYAEVDLSRAGIVLILICLTTISLWGVSRYTDGAVIPEEYDAAEGTPALRDTVLVAQPLLYVSIPNLNLRKEPGLSSKIIEVLHLGDPVHFLDEHTDWSQEVYSGVEKITDYWVKIRTQSGQEGWVFGAYIHYYKR